MADKSVTVNVVVERGLAARFKSMSDDLAHVHTVLVEAKAKAAAYDVLTEALRSHLSRAWAADKLIDEEQVVKALQRAEDAYRADLARGQETLASRGNPQG